jgi:CBS domain-containing protein
MISVQDLLESKGSSVLTIGEDATVLQAVELMNSRLVGCVVVTSTASTSKVAGIFTERDVLRRVVGERRDPARTVVSSVMTRKVVCCAPDTSLHDVRSVMKERRIRHLPVCDDDGTLLGILSIGDLNAWDLRDGEVTIQYLHEYIHGRV